MVVGHDPEPVFEDNIYHTDLFLSELGADGNETPINSDCPEDEIPTEEAPCHLVDLELHVFLVENDEFIPDGAVLRDKVIAAKKLEGLTKRFGTENRYGSAYKVTHDGAFGFQYTGTVVTDNAEYHIDEIFVCGDGHSPDVEGAFSCVEDPVTFPGNEGDKDREGYRDNDNFSLRLKRPEYTLSVTMMSPGVSFE
jgi:hypothetical protein